MENKKNTNWIWQSAIEYALSTKPRFRYKSALGTNKNAIANYINGPSLKQPTNFVKVSFSDNSQDNGQRPNDIHVNNDPTTTQAHGWGHTEAAIDWISENMAIPVFLKMNRSLEKLFWYKKIKVKNLKLKVTDKDKLGLLQEPSSESKKKKIY